MYKIAGGQVTGSRHLERGEEGQDRIAYYRNDIGACIALADGAGSRRMSQYAAEIVTREFSEYLVENFAEIYKYEKAEELIYEKCMDIIRKIDIPKKEVACTLLCYAIVEGSFISVHVGDGMIAYVGDTDKKVLSKPQNGGDISETRFVQVGMELSSIRINKGVAQEGIYFLMSDGTMRSLFSIKEMALTEAVCKLSQWMKFYEESEVIPSVLRFLDEMCRCNTHDDMSLNMIQYVPEMGKYEQRKVIGDKHKKNKKEDLHYTNEISEEEDEYIGYTSRELNCPDEYYDMDRHWDLDRLYDLDEYYP